MMTWFYPILLGYQSGAVIAGEVRERNIPVEKVTFYKISDANFYLYADSYTKLLVDPDSLQKKVEQSGKSWVITDGSGIGDLTERFRPARIDTFQYYPVTMLTAEFLNPVTRPGVLQNWYLVELQ